MFENIIRQTLVTPNFRCLRYPPKIKKSLSYTFDNVMLNYLGYFKRSEMILNKSKPFRVAFGTHSIGMCSISVYKFSVNLYYYEPLLVFHDNAKYSII